MKLVVPIFSSLMPFAYSRGALSNPPSRQWHCSGGPSPNNDVKWNGVNGSPVCQPDNHAANINYVITDWGGVSQYPGGHHDSTNFDEHKAAIGNQKICSANKEMFEALDDEVWVKSGADFDQTYPSMIKSGVQNFEYSASSPHAWSYLSFYISKEGWVPSGDVSFDDLEVTPFCVKEEFEMMDSVEKFACDVPARTGPALIFSIWQRSDTWEAFYSCSDVVFETEAVTEAVTEEISTQEPATQEPATQEPATDGPDSPKFKRCSCENGIGAVGYFCKEHGSESCAHCYPGFHKTGEFRSKTCSENKCVCENGTASGTCLIDDTSNCRKCDFRYILNVFTHECVKIL